MKTFLILVIIIIISSPLGAKVENFLSFPGFEKSDISTNVWNKEISGTGSVNYVTAESHSGTMSAKLNSSLSSSEIILYQKVFGLIKGVEYKLGAYILTQNITGSGGAYIALFICDSSGNTIETYKSSVKTGSSGWEYVTINFKINLPIDDWAYIKIAGIIKNATGTAYFDDFNLGLTHYNSTTPYITDNDPFGIHIVSAHLKDDYLAQKCKELGLNWIRTELRWEWWEPYKDGWDWSYTDEVVENIERYEFKPLVYLTMVDRLVWGEAGSYVYLEKNVRYWARAIYQLVSRYNTTIKDWEIFNESNADTFWPDGTAEDYARVLRASYIAIKTADPNAKVIGPVCTQNGSNFLARLYSLDCGKFMENISFHVYNYGQGGTPPENDMPINIENIYTVMATNGDAQKEFWITETGYSSYTNADSWAPNWKIANMIPRQMIISLYRRASKIFWFVLMSPFNDPENKESYFGLIDVFAMGAETCTEQYYSYRNFLHLTKDTTFRNVEIDGVVWTGIFEGNDKRVRTYWNVTDVTNEVKVPVNSNASSIYSVSLKGETTKYLTPMNNTVSITLYNKQPLYIVEELGNLNNQDNVLIYRSSFETNNPFLTGEFQVTANNCTVNTEWCNTESKTFDYSVRFDVTNGGGTSLGTIWMEMTNYVEIGKTYRVGAWIKYQDAERAGGAPNDRYNGPSIRIQFFPGIDLLDIASCGKGDATDWEYLEGMFTVPAKATNDIRLYFLLERANATVWIDDIVIYEVKNSIQHSYPLPYVGSLVVYPGNNANVLIWENKSSSSYYNIYRSTYRTKYYNKINSTAVSGGYYIDNTALNGTKYYYQILALNNSGEEGLFDSNPPTGEPSNQYCNPPGFSSLQYIGKGKIKLNWSDTLNTGNISKYKIYRQGFNSGFINIGETEEYNFYDAVNNVGTYYYYVTAISSSGYESAPSEIKSIEIQQITEITKKGVNIDCNFFSPLNGERMGIICNFDNSQKTSIKIYNLASELIKELIKDEYIKSDIIYWDGDNNKNELVPMGIYLIVIQHNNEQEIKKIAVIK